MKTDKPSFFKYGFLSSGSGKLGGALSVSINSLLVALGASAFQIGLINALQTLGETFSQFVGLWYLNLFSSRRKSEIVSMIIIGLPVLVLAIVAVTQTKYWLAVIAGAVFFTGLSGKASYLCWYSWMGSIVPQEFRDYFFGTRSLFGEVGKIIGFIIAFFVLRLNYPILILLTILYFASYVFNNVETGTYFLHPDANRKIIIKNHIFYRMKETLSNKKFANYLGWFILLNATLIANILYLEYFMINKLNLTYSWIPISLILISSSSILSFFLLRDYFPKISYVKKRLVISLLVLLSCIFWLFTDSLPLLIVSLLLTGFSLSALALSEKVDLIGHATQKDEEAHYALFNFVHPLFTTLVILFLNMFQFFKFNFSTVFYITIPLTLASFLFLKKQPLPTH